MDGWSEFCVAQIGASAALAGLVFVGVSINLAKVAAIPQLVSLSLEAILVLATVLGECSILIVPDQPVARLGVEVLVFSLALWLALSIVQFRTFRGTPSEFRRGYWKHFAPGQGAMVAFTGVGIWVLTGDESGLILYLPGTLLCYAAALNYAWVLLIEVNR